MAAIKTDETVFDLPDKPKSVEVVGNVDCLTINPTGRALHGIEFLWLMDYIDSLESAGYKTKRDLSAAIEARTCGYLAQKYKTASSTRYVCINMPVKATMTTVDGVPCNADGIHLVSLAVNLQV